MGYERAIWRFMKTPPANGAWNMAVDEALLEGAGHGEGLPTLRLFAWSPPCLSIGYAQSVSEVDEDRLRANGWDLVRRSTGGRAILHTDELTYSVAGPDSEPRLKGDILASYQRLSEAILTALETLGLPVTAVPQENTPPNRIKDPVCFEAPSRYEITVEGKKLVGSAQARKKGGVLQHGSLPLHGDLGRITQALVYPNEATREDAAERLLSRAATVESVLGRKATWEEAAAAFEKAFSERLNLELEPGELTPEEEARASELMEERFGNDEWTKRV